MRQTWLPFREDVQTITAHRKPTTAEIHRGYGATHYKEFPVEMWKGEGGKPRTWIKDPEDGLRYYRK